MIIYTTSQDFHEEIDTDLVLLAFSSTWCEPCKRMHSILEELDSEMSGTMKIVEIDSFENQDIVKRFDIIGTPTLVLLKDGEVLGKIIGFQPKVVVTDFIRIHI